MASIVETITGDRKLVLGNEEFVRQMAIGTFWTKIRVAFRVSFNGASTFASGNLQVGVCQGTTNTFSSSTCTDYIGIAIGGSYLPSYTFGAGPPARYNLPAGATHVKKTGNSVVTVSTTPFVSGNVWAAPATTRGIYGVDITKGATYNQHLYTANVATGGDINGSNFLSWIETETAPSAFTVGNLAGNADSDWNVAYSGAGLFDTVSIVWNKSTPTIEISDVCVVRFY